MNSLPNEMCDNTWIKLPRSFTHWRWYHNSNMVHLYLYLLLNANHKDEERNKVLLHQGELLTSVSELTSKTGLSIGVVRNCLEKLSKTKEITSKSFFNKGRLITLLNYDQFQPSSTSEDSYGWIKLYRNICDWQFYNSSKTVHLYVNILAHAEAVKLPDGKVIVNSECPLRWSSSDTGIKVDEIKGILKRLQSSDALELEQIPGFISYMVSINNQDFFDL